MKNPLLSKWVYKTITYNVKKNCRTNSETLTDDERREERKAEELGYFNIEDIQENY
ncbi:MAG: hypothetical protein IPM51_00005 [Sphingobacteriaceae bacterium]|nr:hypothetical protein [Sphingobacteriaceae bacterium]